MDKNTKKTEVKRLKTDLKKGTFTALAILFIKELAF